MRVISGTYRGKKLECIEGENTRPTTDRVKENMFNLIMFDVVGANVLDLFSGSGSLGIECLSRGANHVDFNDNNIESVNIIKKNLTNIKADFNVYSTDYKSFLNKKSGANYSLIFVDPPYCFNIENELLDNFIQKNILDVGGLVVYESNKELIFDNANYELVKSKKYGITYVNIIRRIS